MLKESHANYEALERAWDELLHDHEGQWVAAHHGEFVFGGSPQEVLQGARKLGWPLAVVAIDRLSRERPSVVL